MEHDATVDRISDLSFAFDWRVVEEKRSLIGCQLATVLGNEALSTKMAMTQSRYTERQTDQVGIIDSYDH